MKVEERINVKHWMNVTQRIDSWTVNQSWCMNESWTVNVILRVNQKL